MKKILIATSFFIIILTATACKRSYKDFVPPEIYAEGEILEINGHEITLKVISSGTDYCKAGDVIKGELKGFDYQYNKYQFKVGDIMKVWSDFDSVTETEVKFDSMKPVDYTSE